jgi:hypothetical protein
MNYNIGFHSEQLGVRGTEVAMYDYAKGNEEILGNKSYIIAPKNSDLFTLSKFQERFNVFLYDTFDQVEKFVQDNNIYGVYYIKYGFNDGKLLKSCKNLVHTVFQSNEPHGDKYVFIAQWLSKKMTGDDNNYVPHILSLPDVTQDYREFLNIPKDAIVFGRHGGYTEFDYEWAYPVVYKVAKENPNIFFLFLNTKPFCDSLPNIIHLEPTYDLETKTAFINTCDALLHSRRRGEIFSLTIGEFLCQDKAVISCPQGQDEGHVVMLKDKGIWYNNDEELYQILSNFKRTEPKGYYKELVEEYTAENVMDRFNKMFLP